MGLAEAVYVEKAFDRLTELANALREAGCDDDDIGTHRRGGRPHVRGCGLVDLVLA